MTGEKLWNRIITTAARTPADPGQEPAPAEEAAPEAPPEAAGRLAPPEVLPPAAEPPPTGEPTGTIPAIPPMGEGTTRDGGGPQTL